MTNAWRNTVDDRIRLLPGHITVAQARELVPRGMYGIVVDDAGAPLTCLYALERTTRAWPGDATLDDMRAQWPGLITLPALQAADPRRVALHLLDELRAHPNAPGIVLVDERGQPVGIIARTVLNQAAPETTRELAARDLPSSKGVSAGAPEPPVERKLVTRYGQLQLPGQLPLHVPCKLAVAIRLEPDAAARGQVELSLRTKDWPLQVLAWLPNVPPEDFLLDGPDRQVIEVPKDRDSAVYTFTLIPQSLGKKTLKVEFWHRSLFRGRAELTTTVVEREPAEPGEARVEHPPVFAYAGPPPDFTIRVDKVQDQTYAIRVARAGDDPLQPPRRVGEIDFQRDPGLDMQKIYDELNDLAKKQGGQAKILDGLEMAGGNLYNLLFRSKEFQEFYWQEMWPASEPDPENPPDRPRPAPVVQVVSSEPYTTWELVRPWRRPPVGRTESDPLHLCERFALARWNLDGPGPSGDLRLRTIAVVAPPSNLKNVQPEVDGLQALAAERGLECQVIKTKAALIELLQGGEADILHFACHGKFDLQEAESSRIVLGSETMKASEIVGNWINWNGRLQGRQPSRPLVFFNVCDSAQIGLGLTGLDGWADRFLSQADAGFFIGSIWKTTDELACVFALGFYRRLLAGTPVAEALRQAREDVKRERVRLDRDRDATHLTYSVFANPQATCGLPVGD